MRRARDEEDAQTSSGPDVVLAHMVNEAKALVRRPAAGYASVPKTRTYPRPLMPLLKTLGKHLRRCIEKERRLRAKVTENKRSFWDRLFGTNNRSGRQDKVLEYVIHRIEDGANLRRCCKKSMFAATLPPTRSRASSRTPGSSRPQASSCAKTSLLGSSTHIRGGLRSRQACSRTGIRINVVQPFTRWVSRRWTPSSSSVT